MRNIIILILFFLTIFPSESPGRKTIDDCLSHKERCEDDCYGEHENVRVKSETTKKYLDRCIGICERRNISCQERVKKLNAANNRQNFIYSDDIWDNSSVADPNEIYKYIDNSGQYHVVDDIDKIPQKYRDQVDGKEE